MQMDYFRRPQIVGKALQRLDTGTVRGSKRRLDPDITSSVPYFAGVSTGDTVTLDVDGTPVSVPFSGATPTYQSILNDINSALGILGQAKDADGSLEVSTFTPGGYVQVTGGTGAKAVGFDITRHRIRSSGGDLRSTPERRVGNPFGAAFPLRGEDMGVEPFNRALGRVSANLDVLFSEHIRESVSVVKIPAGSTTLSSPDTNTTLITLPALTRVYTGLNSLNSTPDLLELAPFFMLVDPVTGLPPATCRVIDVARGAVGSPPLSDAATFAGAGSVVNVDLVKAAGTIDLITDARVIESTASNFLTNNTAVGDWVRILAATNVAPWGNNGYRWVVEEIIDATHIALRPMSKSELAQANPVPSFTEEQPIVELNDKVTGPEVYGTFEIRTGTWTPGVKLVVQPPIPVGATYDVWVAQPSSLRAENAGTIKSGDYPSVSEFLSQREVVPNGIISGFALSGPSNAPVVGEGYVRIAGKVLRIPARTFNSPADFGPDSTYVLYFNEVTKKVELTDYATFPAFGEVAAIGNLASTNVYRPIARFVVNGGLIIDRHSLVAYQPFAVQTLTVGQGGCQFRNLRDAVEFVNLWSASDSFEVGNDVTDLNTHFEIVLCGSNTASGGIHVKCPSLKIRGINPLIRANVGETIKLTNNFSFVLEDLRLENGVGPFPLITKNANVVSKASSITIKNVSSISSTAKFTAIVVGVSGTLTDLLIENCDLDVTESISRVNGLSGAQRLRVLSSVIRYSGVGSARMFSNQGTVSATWTGSEITVKDNNFLGWFSATDNYIMVEDSTSSVAVCNIVDNKFTFGSFASGSKASLIYIYKFSQLSFRDNYATNAIPRVIHASSSGTSEVSGNTLFVAPTGTVSGEEAIRAHKVLHNTITSSAPNGVRGIVVAAEGVAVGNRISGQAHIGITDDGGGEVDVSSNLVDIGTLSGTAQNGIKAHCILIASPRARVLGNSLRLDTSAGYAADAAVIGVVNQDNTNISGNQMRAFGSYMLGVTGSPTTPSSVFANNICIDTGTTTALSAALKLRGGWVITGNTISSSALSVYAAIKTGDTSVFAYMDGNRITTPVAFDLAVTPVATARVLGGTLGGITSHPNKFEIKDARVFGPATFSTGAVVEGCEFNSTVTLSLASSVDLIKFRRNSCLFSVSSTGAAGIIEVEGNHFSSSCNLSSTVTPCFVDSNRFDGAYTAAKVGRLRDNLFNSTATVAGRTLGTQSLLVEGNEFLGVLTLTEQHGHLRLSQNKVVANLSVTKTALGTGFTSFTDNHIIGAMTLSSGGDQGDSAINKFDGNYFDGSSGAGQTLRNSVVKGNHFTNGLVSFIGCQFSDNYIYRFSIGLTDCQFDNNFWHQEALQGSINIISTGSPSQSSNNQFYTDDEFTISGNFRSCNDWFWSMPVIDTTRMHLVNTHFEGALSFGAPTGLATDNIWENVTVTDTLNIGSCNLTLTDCVLGTIDSTAWALNQTVIVNGGQVFSVAIAPASIVRRAGSKFIMNHGSVEDSVVLSGVAQVLVNGSRLADTVTLNSLDDNDNIWFSDTTIGGMLDINPLTAAVQPGSVVRISGCSLLAADVVGAASCVMESSDVSSTLNVERCTTWTCQNLRTGNDIGSTTNTVGTIRMMGVICAGAINILASVLVFMRACSADSIVGEDIDAAIDVSDCSTLIDIIFGKSARSSCRITNCSTTFLSGGGSRVHIEGNQRCQMLVTWQPNASVVTIKNNTARVIRGGEFAIKAEGAGNGAIVEVLDISGNTIEVDNLNGAGNTLAQGIDIGNSALSLVNSHRVHRLSLRNNSIAITRAPNTVSLASDFAGLAIQADCKVYSGIISGNEIDLPRPGTAFTGGGFMRYRYFRGLRLDAEATNVQMAGNHFMKTAWTHAATPAIGARTSCDQTYDTGDSSIDPIDPTVGPATGITSSELPGPHDHSVYASYKDPYNGGFVALRRVDQEAILPNAPLT